METKTDTVCMRENPFYVDTVRDFRDRRYDFKRLVKTWGDKMRAAQKTGDTNETENAKNRVTLYESLQLAHKIILNSFYGYVMRRGARWYSMEMAAMVTHTGGNIIMDSRSLYDQIGMPLELDTDGIWTLLPKGFPETFTFKFLSGKTFKFDFPCTMSNELIYYKYGNPQYQTLVDQKKGIFDQRLEMSIFFEIDGPYKCMLIPASKEENKMLKKRYAVFNHAGKMTEVKGFELKRRGELQIIKIFQQEVFTKFLEGSSLQECYDACGEVASRWYDILETKGEYVEDSELIDYIGESRVIGKSLEEYGSQRSAQITCAKRLAECIGSEIVMEKGLNVKFIIAKKPNNASVTDRAIPTVIFETEELVMKKFLKKWTGDSGMQDFDLRTIIDWDYYKERLAGTIMKIVTIPAALQRCLNPVPQIVYPDWLLKRIKDQNDKFKQRQIGQFFKTADIEDLAQRQIRFAAQAANIAQQKKEVTAKAIAQKPVLTLENCPPPTEQHFPLWLKHQKTNWRRIRKEFKTDSRLLKKQTTIPGVLKGSQALMSFIRNNDDTVLNSNWHILQIESTFEPGILKLWVLTTQGFMFNVRLQVGRTVFINSKVVNDDPDFKKVQKDLPRNRKLHYLYEWQTSEEDFQQKFNSIKYSSLLNNNIEGIYETKVPPKFRALIELGNLVKPKKQMIPRNEQAYGRTYRLSELETVKSEVYLEQDSFERIYLLHSSTDKRHLWGLFIAATHEIYYFIVNPAMKSISTQGQISLESAFQKNLTELGIEVDFSSWQVIEQKNVLELNQALKLIEHKLIEHKSRNKNATVCVLQSEMSPSQLQFMGVPSLSNDFPVIRCPVISGDNEFPALDWLKYAQKNMTSRFSEVELWLDSRIQFSRNTVIPLCNIESDAQSFVIDTLLARNLINNKHLLWYSDSAKPDLGGHEDRNFRLFVQEDIENPELNNSGFYRKYSVEIHISQLVLNTILMSDHNPELENLQATGHQSKHKKTDSHILNQAGQDFDADLDEFNTCAAAFANIKKIVGLWWNDLEKYGTPYADVLLQHFYRWLTSSNSKLYDPLIHRMIHKMMKKNFFWLISKFKGLGCQIVHGDFQKLILTTDKHNFEEARTHIDFVLSQIKQDPMFECLSLNAGEFWQILLWKDTFNYAGITESNPEKMSLELNVTRHLPEAIRNKFKMTVLDLLTKVLKYNKKLDRSEVQLAEGPIQKKSEEITDYMEAVEDFKKEKDHDWICKLIDEYFTQKLLRAIEEILEERKKAMQEVAQISSSDSEGEEVDDAEIDQQDYRQQQKKREQGRRQRELNKWEFPQKIGSYNDYTVPALEFCKMLCNHVFGLDQAFRHPTQIMFRNMLTMLRVKEFSQEVVTGKEPSLTLVVPDVICTGCQSIIDLDICRTTTIYEDANQETPKPTWFCGSCDDPLNRDQIERRLLDILNRRMINYQLQDLKCKTCKMISNQVVKRYCACTGKLEKTVGFEPPEKLTNQNLLNQMTDVRLVVKLMRNFGERHEMKMLQSAADNLLLMMPQSN